jgi:hypothetical protein
MKTKVLVILFLAALTAILINWETGAKASERKAAEADSLLVGSTTLVISQAYGGGGGATGTYSADYVELKNISSTPQSLDTLSIMYGSATGQFGSSAGNIQALPATTLAPGQFYLIQLGTVGSGGIPVPSPDLTNTSTNMAAASGKVALVTSAFTGNTCGATATPCTLPNAAIIDVVSYGASNNAEGGAPANGGVALTSTQGNVRKGNGCTDTDNNNADFDIVTAPVPRNSTTTPAPCSAAAPAQHVFDYNGDGKTDYVVTRNTGGGPTGQITWFTKLNGGAESTFPLGLASDFFLGADFDGDGKTDITVWRPGAPGTAAFYILQSMTGTLRIVSFGQSGDDPAVIGDYSGDGKADPAIYRAGANAGDKSTWWYLPSSGPNANIQVPVIWGQNGDFPAPGDYDGDGKADFAIQRNSGGGQGRFYFLLATGATPNTVVFGRPSDNIVPGDYDGDGKTDIATVRGSGSGTYEWWILPSSTGIAPSQPIIFGSTASDFVCQGDYDGDGKVEPGIWRASAAPGTSSFYSLTPTGAASVFQYGANGDFPVANSNSH